VLGWGFDAGMEYTGTVPAEVLNAHIDRGFWVEAQQPLPDRDGPLDLHLVYDVDVDGRPQLYALTIRSFGTQEGITADHLRRVRLGEIHAKVRAALQRGEQSDWSGEGPEFDPPMPPDGWVTEFRQTPRPGRRGRDDLWYAQLADAYVSSPSRTRVKDLAERLHLSASQVSNLLHEAGRRKILTDREPGKAGGRLTQYGKDLLDGTP
jgi:hypothetical protein